MKIEILHYHKAEYELDSLKEWLDKIISSNETTHYDYVKINKESEGKWMPLVPPYDYLKMEISEEIDGEYENLQTGKYFNDHGLGFDMYGNDLNNEIVSDEKISNKLSHDEL